MLIHTKAIVLSRMNYSESDMIIRLYTEKKGMISILQKGIRKTRNSKSALFQPLNILDAVINFNDKKDLQFTRELSSAIRLRDLHFDIRKTSIAFFIAELTYKTILQHETEPELFDFIETSIIYLDQTTLPFSNFHLIYMVKLASYLGFSLSNSLGKGGALLLSNQNPISDEILVKIKTLTELNYLIMEKLEISNQERSEIIDILLDYYYFHIEGLQKIKSREVLTALLSP